MEAPDFLAEIMALEIPPSNDRLAVPVIVTDEKLSMEQSNKQPLQTFLEEQCFKIDGASMPFAELYNKFYDWLDPLWRSKYSKITFGRELPPTFPKGRMHGTPAFYIGNISMNRETEPTTKWILTASGYLERQT